MFIFLIIVGAIVIGLSLPSAVEERSWKRFQFNVLVSLFGVLVPIGVFLLSSFLVPEWKGGCKHGWIDCFIGGKLALSPLVLWSTSSLYAVEVLRIQRPVSNSIVLGLWTGAGIAAICLFYCLFAGFGKGGMGLWLIVPAYIALWQGWRAFQLGKETEFTVMPLIGTLVASLPCCIGSVIWSQKWYESLPDQPPSCFVVTAAGRGHHNIVGPFRNVSRHGRTCSANQQLLTLWQFEATWGKRSPRTHRAFRCIYNQVGPVVARRITSRWVADITYLALKPVELVAALVLNISVSTNKTYERN